MSRVNFFYSWESRKSVGVNGAERGEGGFFAVPHCALQPQYGCRYLDARENVYCSFFCFRFKANPCLYITVRCLQCSFFNKVFLNWIETLNYKKRMYKNEWNYKKRTDPQEHSYQINSVYLEIHIETLCLKVTLDTSLPIN